MQIENHVFYGWKGYHLSAGEVSVGVVPEIGGRIISLAHRGEEMLYVQDEQAGQTFDFTDITDLRAEKRRLGFGLWGGDKTWVAPQPEWWEEVPPLELDAGKYSANIEGNAIVMESPVCRETGLRIIRRVELQDDETIILDQTLINESDKEARKGIWDVTQTLRPFDVYIPISRSAVRPYPEEGDSVKLYDSAVKEEEGWTRVICNKPAHFKFGGKAERGVVLALRRTEKETIAFIRKFDTDPSAQYLHDSSVEIYNSPQYDYLEIEVHAPFTPLAPNAQISHRQYWRIGRIEGNAGPSRAETEINLP